MDAFIAGMVVMILVMLAGEFLRGFVAGLRPARIWREWREARSRRP